ncbi:MAG: type III-A CRISPR-associated RAMP protein Csm5 [Phycisphaerae bacterium]
MSNYQLHITALSPIHIGTGDELTPDEYVICPGQGDGSMLYAVNLPAFFADMTTAQRRKFNQAVAASSITAVRKFLADNVDISRHTRWRSAASPELYELYRHGLDDASQQLQVRPMTRTGTDRHAYIPGSSIKGAIRTAVLQDIVDADDRLRRITVSQRPRRREAASVEARILGNIRSNDRPEIRADPFRAVRVGDCRLPTDATAVDPVDLISLRRGRGGADPAGIQMFYEMTFSMLDDEEIRGHGTLNIKTGLADIDTRRVRRWDFDHAVSRTITVEKIVSACNQFYRARLEDESGRVRAVCQDVGPVYDKLLHAAEGMRDNETLIRLGRFSHVECVTLARPLSRARGGNSRALAAGQLPMGWAKLTISNAGS